MKIRKVLLVGVLSVMNIGCAIAEDVHHTTDDMLPGYVCTTKEQMDRVINVSKQTGYNTGFYEAKRKMVEILIDKIKDGCENVGSGNELRISEDLVLICK
ncbi:MAG: hypothetical protein GY861_04590 [bacterium]|nr:hypothetical protein [bacterium]